MKQSPAIHESFARDEGIQSSSDRVFGLVMAGVLFVLALLPLLRGRGMRWWSLTAAVAFLLSALLFPRVLRRLNWLWLKVGLVLHAIVNGYISIRRRTHIGSSDALRGLPRIRCPVSSETAMVDFVFELWSFIRIRKKYWLLPIIVMLAVFGGLILLAKGSAVAPFIYTLF